MNKNKRQKRCNKNINRLTDSLFDMGMPLWRVIKISKSIYKQIQDQEDELSCRKQYQQQQDQLLKK